MNTIWKILTFAHNMVNLIDVATETFVQRQCRSDLRCLNVWEQCTDVLGDVQGGRLVDKDIPFMRIRDRVYCFLCIGGSLSSGVIAATKISYSIDLSSSKRVTGVLDDECPIDHRNKGKCAVECIVVDLVVQVIQCVDVGCTKTR